MFLSECENPLFVQNLEIKNICIHKNIFNIIFSKNILMREEKIGVLHFYNIKIFYSYKKIILFIISSTFYYLSSLLSTIVNYFLLQFIVIDHINYC